MEQQSSAIELQSSSDYEIVEKALQFLGDNYLRQPSLAETAEHVGMSEYHFQRVFSRWAGVSPKRFLQFLTKEHARELLDLSVTVLDAAYQSGLSGPGRLHDLFVNLDAVTPGEYKMRGAGLDIYYGFHPSPFGECMLALTERGICSLGFVLHADHQQLLDELHQRWPAAAIYSDPSQTALYADSIFNSSKDSDSTKLKLFLHGTNFQIKVWEALLRIPSGWVSTYETIAGLIGNPKSARAVGQAVGANPISFIIPCHRVIRKIGDFGDYHWGKARKKAILGWEFAALQQNSPAEVEI